MKRCLPRLLGAFLPIFLHAELLVGIAKTDITPPVGTPSAGFVERLGQGMEGVHDPLFATALWIDNEKVPIALCSVDHLGFTHEMYKVIVGRVHERLPFATFDIYIGSSHTHSGGGSYLNLPFIGEGLAGVYNEEITQFYIEKTVEAIVEAYKSKKPSKIGIGYGHIEDVAQYRGVYPVAVEPLTDMTLIKVTDLAGMPKAVLFNFPVHPTVLNASNRLFSADFVGYARNHIKELIGGDVEAVFFNGAQGDIIPVLPTGVDRYEMCDSIGLSIAKSVKEVYESVVADDVLNVQTKKYAYSFKPQATPFGLELPIDKYESEINAIVLDEKHAFVTIPGEMSCLYDKTLKKFGKKLGFEQVSFFGLTNDAHGYIILPEAWRRKTFEAALSFGGQIYGDIVEFVVKDLLSELAPKKETKEVKILPFIDKS